MFEFDTPASEVQVEIFRRRSPFYQAWSNQDPPDVQTLHLTGLFNCLYVFSLNTWRLSVIHQRLWAFRPESLWFLWTGPLISTRKLQRRQKTYCRSEDQSMWREYVQRQTSKIRRWATAAGFGVKTSWSEVALAALQLPWLFWVAALGCTFMNHRIKPAPGPTKMGSVRSVPEVTQAYRCVQMSRRAQTRLGSLKMPFFLYQCNKSST